MMTQLSRYRMIVVMVILFLFFITACERSQNLPKIKPQNPLWGEYISSHSSGLISRKSKIRVRFVNNIVDKSQVGQDASSFMNIEPPIKGQVTFSDTREIVVVPEDDLKSGQHYLIRVLAHKLIKLPAELKTYEFAIQVIQQEFEVKIAGLLPDPLDNKKMTVQGTLVTADVEDAEDIERILNAVYLKSSLKIEWQHNVDGKHHDFTIHGIERKDKKNESIKFEWNGGSISVDSKGTSNLEVPAKNVFKVTDIKAVQGEHHYIAIYFSDNVSPRQNLRGLVRVGNNRFTTRVEGNAIKIYPEHRFVGKIDVTIEKGIRNEREGILGKQERRTVAFTSEKPQVRFAGRGVVLPDNEILSIPFEAINVNSVQVTAFRIYENNIGKFLQVNKLDGNYEQDRVGRYLWRKTIYLSSPEPDTWNRYSIDATQLLKDNPGGLFRLTLSINRSNSTYSCSEEDNNIQVNKEEPLKNSEDLHVKESSGWDYADDYYGQSSYNWRDRDNPCKDSYYKRSSEVRASQNFMASNIGLLAKRGQRGEMKVIATNLRTSEVMSGVKISIMNFQEQVLKTVTTDGDGFAMIDVAETPFYLVAEKGGQKGYLKLNAGTALPMSHFDVGGEHVKDGIKGYIYGERGVWRPGDDIYLTFVLQDKDDVIPPDHPVTMKIYNPKGQLIQRVTNSQPVGDFYSFTMKTADDALTGNWMAKAQLGGSTFTKKIKIEMVIPNRLKVELDFGKDVLYKSEMPVRGKVFSQWLSGATASKLKTDVNVRLGSVPTKFERFADYVFDDPVREFRSDPQTIFEGTLDATGNAVFTKELRPGADTPGMLSARFTTRVFEQGGAFSSSRISLPYYPYENYVGIKLPKGDRTRGMLLTDKVHTASIATVNERGEPVDLDQVEVTLYKIGWKWWWDKSGESLAQYSSARHSSVLKKGTISTKKGQGKWEFEIKYPEWGRYLIRACDPAGGHCTGKVVYIDWPGWAGRAQEESGAGANVLNFFSDKQEYDVGETAVIQLPEATQGRALVSIENGSRMLKSYWVEFKKGKTRLHIPMTNEMSPNVYISVTLIQPHEDKKNDRPIRLYGVIPLIVRDRSTILNPVLKAADEWAPKSSVSISVSEEQGRPMTYTVAVVDEGLLGLTAFKTPDLHKQFYKKEALGVTTWDMFDYVAGAYGAELERLLALGGDEEAKMEDESKTDKKRFPPVVRFLGPFNLKKGKTTTHEFELPQYVGSVRVMIVAGESGAYGHTSKSVFVREALTLLPTLPRVIGPEEEMTVPVAVFVMDDKIKNVTLKVMPDEHFQITGSDTVRLRFDKPGDKLGLVKMKVNDILGKGTIRFSASEGSTNAESEVFIDIRSPNTRTVRHFTKVLKPQESWEQMVVPHGLTGTNEVSLEVSSVPPLDLESRLQYLIRYPHGCVEQVTSSVFPQIYLPSLVHLEDNEKEEIEKNVQSGIDRLRSFQISNGGFVYWPGGFGAEHANDWATNYVGHFLLEAQKIGYYVPPDMLSDWANYQKSHAQSWTAGGNQSKLDQAYRLYTLALAGQAELGAMNRLREATSLDTVSRWQLAAAYQLAGQFDAAGELIRNEGLNVKEYETPGPTFGSRIRDRAIILNSLVALNHYEKAEEVVEEISNQLAGKQWYSTQSVAYSLMAMSKYVGGSGSDTAFTFTQRLGTGNPDNINSKMPIFVKQFDAFPLAGQTIHVQNTSSRNLTGRIIVKGIPKAGEERATSSGLGINVSYMDMNMKSLDVSQLSQGTDFTAQIRIENNTGRDLENIALSHIAPSGWEIHNKRFDSGEEAGVPDVDYEDIRDDRIYTYFGLKAGASKVITATFNAAYLGKYYMPGISVEAMYDATKNAHTKGQWVTVIKKDQ